LSTAEGEAGGREVDLEVAGERRRIHCRESGHGGGPVLLFLHGGWGYGAYPLPEPAQEALEQRFRLLIPDRTGYGRSARRPSLPIGFHRDAALETLALLAGLGVERAALWGHSDGAVIAAIAGGLEPARVSALVLEAAHLDRVKPRSREFFQAMASAPESFGAGLARALEADHGAGWRDVLAMEGRAWLEILDTSDDPTLDIYAGLLEKVEAPTLLLHGERDPRTEPGELEALHARLGHARLRRLPGGGHSPHSEERVSEQACAAALGFLVEATRGSARRVHGPGPPG
jgi:pimeloyl-ACP methyl ester carboxylesterase